MCLVSPLPPPYGGISRWTELIHTFAKFQNNLEIIQIDTAPRWRSINDLRKRVRIIGGTLQFFRDFYLYFKVLHRKPGIVHITTSGSLGLFHNLIFCLFARLTKIPVILHIRFGRVPEIAAQNTLEWQLLKFLGQLSTKIIAITPQTAETLNRNLRDVSVIYIPNPIDISALPAKLNTNQKRKVALFLGWVLPSKGVSELVQAWSELNPSNWDLFIVGPGSLNYRQQLIEKFNPTHLYFVGEVNHKKALQMIADCDLFILPSYTEGFPNVILEAMGLGKAIIATNVGAIPEMLSNNCGLVIPAKNIEKLKNGVATLIVNDQLRFNLWK